MNRLFLVVGGLVALVIVAGGAFVAARLLSSAGEATTGNGNFILESSGAGGNFVIGINREPAPELPTTPPEVGGLFVRREDNSLFVGTGDIEVTLDVEEGGEPQMSADFNGPVLEVVITRETEIYRDDTEFPTPSQETSGEQTVQQIVSLVDNLEDLNPSENGELQVWGSRSGDRVTATVLVYRPLSGS